MAQVVVASTSKHGSSRDTGCQEDCHCMIAELEVCFWQHCVCTEHKLLHTVLSGLKVQ